MARRRRALRWILWTFGGLIALVVLAVGGALAALQTTWGRRFVERQVESALNGALRGHVEIGALEGNLLGRVVALDVVVRDGAGHEAIRIPRLEASYDLLGLASQAIRLDDVRLVEPMISARRDPHGRLNLAEILPLPAPAPRPSAWTIVIDHATVTGGKLTLDDLHLDGIQVALAVDQGGARLRLDLDRAQARWVENDLVIEARGRAVKVGDVVKLDGVELRVGGARLTVAHAAGRADGSEVDAELAIDVRDADVRRFLPDLPLRGELSATGTIRRNGAGKPFAAHLRGTLDGVAWGLEADLDGAALVTLHVDARAPGAHLDLDAAVDLAARPLMLRSARLRAGAPVSAYAGAARAQGDVDADLTASGPLADLKVAGVVRGTALRYGDLRAATLVVDGALAGLPGDLVGHVRVVASGVRQGRARIGDVRVEGDVRDGGRHLELSLRAGGDRLAYGASARAQVDRTPGDRTVIQVGELTVRTRGLVWRGHARDVTVDPDGGVAVRDLSLASTAGRIVASGELRAAGDRLDVDVKVLRLEEILQALAPDVPGLPDLRGAVDTHLTLTQQGLGLRQARVHITARSLELRPTTDPVSVDVEASLSGRDVSARLSVDGGLTGTMKLALDTRAPLDPLDVAAWRRMDERDVRKLHVELTRLDVARLLQLLKHPDGPTGLIDAAVDVGPAFSTLQARFTTAGLVTAYVDAPLSAEVTFALAQRRLAIEGHVRRDGGGTLALSARVAAPARLSNVTAWRRLDADDVEDVSLVLEGIELAWWKPLRERFPDLEGTLGGTLTARALGDDLVTADLRFENVRVASLLLPLSARLRTSLYDERITVDLDAQLGERQLVAVRGTIAAGLSALRSGRGEAFLAAAATGDVQVKAFPLEILRRAMNLPLQASGVLGLEAQVAGTVRHPGVELRASLTGSQIGKVAFARLETRAHLDPRHLTASLVATQEGGGSLQTDVEASLGDLGDGKLTLQAKRFDLGFLALFARERGFIVSKGLLDADLAIDGGLAGHHPRGSLRISDGDLRLTEMMGTLHEAGLEVTLGPGDAVAVKLDTKVGTAGRLTLDGTANLVGLDLREARGTFASHKLSVSAGKTTAQIDARGSFTGAKEADLYALTATLEDGAVNLPQLSGGKVHPTGIPEDVIFVDARGRREHLEIGAGAPFLVVHLRSARSILVTSSELRAELRVRLDATIAAGGIALRGQIRIENGFVELFSRRWNFQASTLELDGERPPNPRLDLKLNHEFRTTTVVIALGGTLARPVLALLVASGDYDQAQLLGFVLGGSPDDGGPANAGDVSQQALGAGVGLVFGQLQPLLKKLVPVDMVSLQTQSGGKEDTVFTVGKWFFSDLFVAYQQRFGSQASEQQNTYEGKLEWYFARGFRLDLILGDRGEGSADVLSVHRW